MVSEKTAPSSVTNNPPEVAPGIPAVEVDPTNELLDGENLGEKKALLDDPHANVQVDPSGRRLEHKDAAAAREAGEDPLLVIPPPASANLELRKRTEKLVAGMYESIGAGPEPDEDPQTVALRTEREGLQRRADAGDESAKRRVGQVDEQISARDKQQAGQKRQQSAQSGTGDAEGEARTTPPVSRSTKPTTKS